ncbi:salicylate synthase [Rhodococcus sp. 15-725-2-2b]|uniref:salicylate synthase n=1 Tax=unclassified Rhodococcus (in: high G+C Gram-positive bacteria) TaxID=192944 RepID=UPI000B9B1F2B|nr:MULTISPECIES: salicylate synthase [unclassified Rhodococcus (in: high G+C Gram-positive bacteria)]OZC62900.1 salicylate synthase [Rhodococcus sp. 06-469-3-2]OZC68066.1 salicylate synthase [Rhodococcus sp. 06-470-2]OZD49861.1 salicylate synthase [Rhodococcus sp. 06-1477-1A]OZE62585.1 salicylate synthase [Rhodococcus sp. 05-2221-1B]OZE62624.1 salicylate synthase [Rhodococcus sp. 05-2221-1B]
MTVVEETASGTADTTILQRGLQTVVTLAESGLFDEYVVYEDRGRWVFAGGVVARIVLQPDVVTTTWGSGAPTVRRWSGNPAAALREACDGLTRESWNAYGYVGFGFAAHLHDAVAESESDEVLAHLVVPRVEVRFGHDCDDIEVTGTEEDRAAVFAVLTAASVDEPPTVHPLDVGGDLDDYRGRVAQAVAEIHRGEYAKVILSRTVRIPFDLDMPGTYRAGRAANTPARSFLLHLGDLRASGFSPELVASVDARGVVTTEPLAGTRAFGLGSDADSAAKSDLEQDPKEITEHAVSVRTSFEELESIARPGSTAVSDFMSVRERGSVQHLASTVRARLRDDLSCWDAFGALFPAVTASGIPKREAIEAIGRLDDPPRGLYSGAVVKASSAGELEAALVLRAVYEQRGSAWLRAGAGIVGQSTPDREFDETCEKLGSVAPYLVRKKEEDA